MMTAVVLPSWSAGFCDAFAASVRKGSQSRISMARPNGLDSEAFQALTASVGTCTVQSGWRNYDELRYVFTPSQDSVFACGHGDGKSTWQVRREEHFGNCRFSTSPLLHTISGLLLYPKPRLHAQRLLILRVMSKSRRMRLYHIVCPICKLNTHGERIPKSRTRESASRQPLLQLVLHTHAHTIPYSNLRPRSMANSGSPLFLAPTVRVLRGACGHATSRGQT